MVKKKVFKTIDEYISTFPIETRNRLNSIRELVKNLHPNAVEAISYGIPTFKFKNKKGKYVNLIHFGGYSTHIGVYPTSSVVSIFEKEFKSYVTGKGTVRFDNDKPLPLNLVEIIVKHRLDSIISQY